MTKLQPDTPFIGKLFVDQRPDETFTPERLTINHSTFANVSFKKSKLRNCNLAHCVFIDCYFKYTYLENVIFTGCKFINCTFDNISLIECDFRYAVFENCFIEYDLLFNCLPSTANLRWKICTNLALESLRAGNSQEYRKYFFEEKRSSERHYMKMVLQRERYYKEHYDSVDRVFGLLKYIASKFSKVLWGYGEKISHLIFVIIIVIFCFSLIYQSLGNVFKEANTSGEQRNLNLVESLYFSFCNFLTLTSDFTSSFIFVRILSVIEGALGLVLMGFFVAALFRFINRR